jgi:nucleoside-diphosphate-sugar epimerase
VNLGNPEPITMLQLAKEILELTQSTSKIEFLDLPQDDPLQREPEISKARSLLGWEPIVNRETGLRKTIDYFADLKGTEN